MKSFLEYVAQDIIQKYGYDLTRVAVIFPNKRASLFLNTYLAQIAQRPIWSPSYITISDLFRQHSKLTVGDPIKLICEMYKCYQTYAEGLYKNETLDHFYGWGQILLADFDDIDKNMADADKVFCNLKDIHQLDDLSYLTDEQKALLHKFFNSFNDIQESEIQKRFTTFWAHYGDIYHDFKDALRKQGIAYEGMLYRDVVNDKSLSFKYDHYLFIGFNVVQIVEQKIFSKLKKQGKAHFYWDFDQYYMPQTGKKSFFNEAGVYISQYLKDFPNELDINDTNIYHNMKKEKNMTFASATTENIQARYVAQWLKENDRYTEGRQTAIVLCDESLLESVIHNIPAEVEKINVTTGYPLSNTPIASLISQLLSLHINGYSHAKGRYTLKAVCKVLSHPLIQYISPLTGTLSQQLRQNKVYYPTLSQLQIDTALSTLFKMPIDNLSLIEWITSVLKIIAHNAQIEDPLFQESLFRMYTLFNRLRELVSSGDLDVDIITLQKLIGELISTTSIPFHGEPIEGIQIMGVLETRNLDFKHLLILSCNEGNMPKGVNDSSFIPYSLRKAYGLTTIDNKVAIYAYYFNRLLQRAEDITIVYNNNNTSTGNTGEKSRFMLQLMVESNQHIKQINLQAGQDMLFSNIETIEKDDAVNLSLSQINYLSPTAINRYLRCPLQFYFHSIAKIKEPDEMEDDEIDKRLFGNIFHEAAELLYRPYIDNHRIITTSELEQLRKNRPLLERIVDKALAKTVFNIDTDKDKMPELNGFQIINREVIIRYLYTLIEIDMQNAPFSILGIEQEMYTKIPVKINNETKNITVGGRIDRLDKVVDKETGIETIRVVDYKTSASDIKSPINNIEDIFVSPPLPQKHADYYLQAMLYAIIVNDNYNAHNLPVSPALLFIQKASAKNYDCTLYINKQRINDVGTISDTFKEQLQMVLDRIFDPNQSFNTTSDSNICQYCTYKNICGKMEA